MAKLDKLTVKGFKSIKSLEDFELKNLNILIGANGAGKSNFIGVFRLLNNIYQQNLQLYIQQQGGVDSFLHFGRKNSDKASVSLKFGSNSYECSLTPTNDNTLVFSREATYFHGDSVSNYNDLSYVGHSESKLKSYKTKVNSYIKNSFENWKIYHFHDTSDNAKVKGQRTINDNLVLKSDGENLAPYLYMLKDNYPKEYQRIVDTIRLVLPFFDDFVHRQNVELVELEWFQKGHFDTPLKAYVLSDGSLRFICLMVLLLQPTELLPDTILIDEPELGLHPYAIAILADVIKQVSEDKQIIISTQSVELVNHFEPNDVIVVNQHNGVSGFKRLNNDELSSWLEDYSLGELWASNFIGGRP